MVSSAKNTLAKSLSDCVRPAGCGDEVGGPRSGVFSCNVVVTAGSPLVSLGDANMLALASGGRSQSLRCSEIFSRVRICSVSDHKELIW